MSVFFLKICLWPLITHWHRWLRELGSIKEKRFWDTLICIHIRVSQKHLLFFLGFALILCFLWRVWSVIHFPDCAVLQACLHSICQEVCYRLVCIGLRRAHFGIIWKAFKVDLSVHCIGFLKGEPCLRGIRSLQVNLPAVPSQSVVFCRLPKPLIKLAIRTVVLSVQTF